MHIGEFSRAIARSVDISHSLIDRKAGLSSFSNSVSNVVILVTKPVLKQN